MGVERAAGFYDEVYARVDGPYALGVDEHPWRHLHAWILDRVPTDAVVVDVGCGVGWFAEALARRGHPANHYLGIDFSPYALQRAQARVPGYRFVRGDARRASHLSSNMGDVVVVACEVLEHFTADLWTLRRFRPNTRVLGTVPGHDSAGHVRHFDSVAAVAKRYENALRIDEIKRLGRCYGFDGVVLPKGRP